MQLLDLIFLLLQLLCISEKEPGGSCLSLRAADHRTLILRDKANIRNASDAYVDSIRAETVSICALLYKLLAARDAAAVAQGNWRRRWRRGSRSGLRGPAATVQHP